MRRNDVLIVIENKKDCLNDLTKLLKKYYNTVLTDKDVDKNSVLLDAKVDLVITDKDIDIPTKDVDFINFLVYNVVENGIKIPLLLVMTNQESSDISYIKILSKDVDTNTLVKSINDIIDNNTEKIKIKDAFDKLTEVNKLVTRLVYEYDDSLDRRINQSPS